MNKDDMSDDAEFDAFLKGEGLLARQLQSLPQAVPADQLDAAIMQRARELMAQESRPLAANDAGSGAPAPRLAALSWRWRVPAGIAATVLAGVFAHHAFQASEDMESRVGMPAPAVAQERVLILQPPAAPPMSPPMELVIPAQVARPAIRPAPPPPAPAPRVAAPVAAAPAADAVPRVEAAASPAPRAAAESAPGFILPPPEPALKANLARRFQPAPSEAAEWLAEIEAMLGGGKDKELLGEWRKFRKAHPDYPVPESTSERIEALQE